MFEEHWQSRPAGQWTLSLLGSSPRSCLMSRVARADCVRHARPCCTKRLARRLDGHLNVLHADPYWVALLTRSGTVEYSVLLVALGVRNTRAAEANRLRK